LNTFFTFWQDLNLLLDGVVQGSSVGETNMSKPDPLKTFGIGIHSKCFLGWIQPQIFCCV